MRLLFWRKTREETDKRIEEAMTMVADGSAKEGAVLERLARKRKSKRLRALAEDRKREAAEIHRTDTDDLLRFIHVSESFAGPREEDT